jgi:formylglycine-generating enzyme required for sulfatase activity
MKHMKIRTIGLALACCFLGAAAGLAADPHMGTWKLNERKSKITPETRKNTQVVCSSMFGQVKVKSDGIDANGKPIHTQWSGKFDGKDYPVTGDPYSDTRAYTRVNERALTTANKKNGKVRVTGQIVVSANGKTRTVTINGTSPKGTKFKNVAVYDKQ